MEGRFEFRCWSCKRKYSLYLEISAEQTRTVACPYCNRRGVFDLAPYRKRKISVLKGDAGPDEAEIYEYQFPDVIPTREAE